MNSLIGYTISRRYRVEASLGRGGMAEVYKVWDLDRATYIALKLLREDLAQDPVFIRRFRHEGETLKSLQHPNIVRYYGLEQEDLLAFILMDFVDGTSLRAEIFRSQGKPFPSERILDFMRPMCSALYYAHRQRVIHCDIKPGNILIDKTGRVLVSDFGIARATDSATATMAGAGTPAYMAPEQARGLDPTPQTDIYALGITLYEMLTGGERPFTGEHARTSGSNSEKIIWEQLNLRPPSLRQYNPKISPALEAVVMRCLEKDPRKRYTDVLTLLNALAGALAGGQIPAVGVQPGGAAIPPKSPARYPPEPKPPVKQPAAPKKPSGEQLVTQKPSVKQPAAKKPPLKPPAVPSKSLSEQLTELERPKIQPVAKGPPVKPPVVPPKPISEQPTELEKPRKPVVEQPVRPQVEAPKAPGEQPAEAPKPSIEKPVVAPKPPSEQPVPPKPAVTQPPVKERPGVQPAVQARPAKRTVAKRQRQKMLAWIGMAGFIMVLGGIFLAFDGIIKPPGNNSAPIAANPPVSVAINSPTATANNIPTATANNIPTATATNVQEPVRAGPGFDVIFVIDATQSVYLDRMNEIMVSFIENMDASDKVGFHVVIAGNPNYKEIPMTADAENLKSQILPGIIADLRKQTQVGSPSNGVEGALNALNQFPATSGTNIQRVIVVLTTKFPQWDADLNLKKLVDQAINNHVIINAVLVNVVKSELGPPPKAGESAQSSISLRAPLNILATQTGGIELWGSAAMDSQWRALIKTFNDWFIKKRGS